MGQILGQHVELFLHGVAEAAIGRRAGTVREGH